MQKSWVLLIPMSLCYHSGMRSRGRLVLFVLLNVAVSACVTLTLLYVYDHYYRASPPVIGPPLATPAEGTLAGGTLDILNVVGAGVLDKESVEIRNAGGSEVDLSGWKLQAANGKAYTFPGLTLLDGGIVTVHTGEGNNTVVDLYWGQSHSAWESGQLVILLDAQGNVRALYRIP
jgi:hypothetical protein